MNSYGSYQEDELGELTTDFNIDNMLSIPTANNFGNSLPNSSALSQSYTNNSFSNSPGMSKSYDIKKSLGKALNTSNNDSMGGITKSRKSSITSKEDTIERKRRDNINDKIQELLSLIPENFFTDDKSTGTKDGKPNKGQILSKSVEYIQNLQNDIDDNNRKEVELQMKIKNLEIAKGIPITSYPHTTAEKCLGRIGVGPLAEQNTNSASNTPNNNSSNSTNTPIGQPTPTINIKNDLGDY